MPAGGIFDDLVDSIQGQFDFQGAAISEEFDMLPVEDRRSFIDCLWPGSTELTDWEGIESAHSEHPGYDWLDLG